MVDKYFKCLYKGVLKQKRYNTTFLFWLDISYLETYNNVGRNGGVSREKIKTHQNPFRTTCSINDYF